jgi:hypothetical protein
MNRVTRRRVDRRGAALDRLQSITTGAAIAGVAATAAFGALAAFTFSGTATAADAPARQNLTDGVVGSDDAVRTEPEAQDVAPFLLAPEPRSATGRGGHATTGGSG